MLISGKQLSTHARSPQRGGDFARGIRDRTTKSQTRSRAGKQTRTGRQNKTTSEGHWLEEHAEQHKAAASLEEQKQRVKEKKKRNKRRIEAHRWDRPRPPDFTHRRSRRQHARDDGGGLSSLYFPPPQSPSTHAQKRAGKVAAGMQRDAHAMNNQPFGSHAPPSAVLRQRREDYFQGNGETTTRKTSVVPAVRSEPGPRTCIY